MCYSTAIKILAKITRFGIYRFTEVTVLPEVDTLGIHLLPTLVLNVRLTIISISRTFIQFEQILGSDLANKAQYLLQ